MSDYDQLENTIKLFLLLSEDLKAILETFVVSADEQSRSFGADSQSRRILAVVTNDRDRSEEGSVFILKSQSEFAAGSVIVQRIFPITPQFSIGMAQSRRGTMDFTSASSLSQPRSEIRLTLSSGPEESSDSMTLITTDVQRLRTILSECKRLKEFTGSENPTYGWLEPYRTKRNPSSIFSSTPQDLRVSRRQLHMRLSPASAGLPGDDIADISVVRQEWIRSRARETCKAALDVKLRIRIGTFNVNGKVPSQDLSPWVRGSLPSQTKQREDTAETTHTLPSLEKISPLSISDLWRNPFDYAATPRSASTLLESTEDDNDVDIDPDLLVFAFQELDLSAEALLYSTSTVKEDAWCMAVFAGLGEKAELYEKLASKQLVGMLLVVIVKKSIRRCFTDIRVCAAGAGIMGIMGNKGGTAVRLAYSPPPSATVASPLPTILTFVNSHLAAYDEMVDKRNADFHDLSRRLMFDSGSASDRHSANGVVSPLSVYESHCLFWMGDLNYRIDIPDADVRSLLASDLVGQNLGTLMKYDQLSVSMRSQKVFEGFMEQKFRTYRLLVDSLGYDRKRKPAWTDRILQLSSHSTVFQSSYTSHPEITMSDHRPISANFVVQPDGIDKIQFTSAVHKLYQQVADFEELEDPPKLKVNSTTIDLGKIRYKRLVSRTLKLQNHGKIPSVYRFVPIELGLPAHPEWLRVEPMAGLLLPEETVRITISAFVDSGVASRLNLGAKRIESTLILHTMLGKDHFISVAGEYEYTCFATKLSRMTQLPGPVRSVGSTQALLPVEHAKSAPREIMRLINWLMSTPMTIDELFLSPANEDLVAAIRECLDTGNDFPFPPAPGDSKTILAFGETLLQLFEALPEPVIHPLLHERCVQVTNRDEAFELLNALPESTVNIWISITAYLHLIVQQPLAGPATKAERLAAIFSDILIRDDPTMHPVSPIGKRNFLMYFIA